MRRPGQRPAKAARQASTTTTSRLRHRAHCVAWGHTRYGRRSAMAYARQGRTRRPDRRPSTNARRAAPVNTTKTARPPPRVRIVQMATSHLIRCDARGGAHLGLTRPPVQPAGTTARPARLAGSTTIRVRPHPAWLAQLATFLSGRFTAKGARPTPFRRRDRPSAPPARRAGGRRRKVIRSATACARPARLM